MDNTEEEEVLTEGPRRISTLPETLPIQGIIEDSPTSDSSLPAEDYTGYTKICQQWSP